MLISVLCFLWYIVGKEMKVSGGCKGEINSEKTLGNTGLDSKK